MGALTLNYSECYGLQVNNGTTVHDINIGPLDIDGTSTGSYGISLTAVGTNSIIDGFSINNVFECTINNPNYTNVGIEMFSNSPSQNAAVKNGKVTGIAVLATGASSGFGLDAVSIGGGSRK